MYGVAGLACDESRWSYQGRSHTTPIGKMGKEKYNQRLVGKTEVLMLYEKSADP